MSPRLMKLLMNPRLQSLMMRPYLLIGLLVSVPLLALVLLGVVLHLTVGSWALSIGVPLLVLIVGLVAVGVIVVRTRKRAAAQMEQMQEMMGGFAEMFGGSSALGDDVPPSTDAEQLARLLAAFDPPDESPTGARAAGDRPE